MADRVGAREGSARSAPGVELAFVRLHVDEEVGFDSGRERKKEIVH